MTISTRILRSTALLLLGGSLLSCAKIDPIDTRSMDEIVWNVVCHRPSATKAANAMDYSSNFQTQVWSLAEGKSWANDKASAVQARFIDNTAAQGVVSYDSSIDKWKIAGKKLMWPASGTLNFLSYTAGRTDLSPGIYKINDPAIISNTQKAKLSATKDGLSVTGWNSDTDHNVDLLVAAMQVNKSQPSSYLDMSGVITEFSHILSQVRFKFYKSDQPINFTDGKPENTTITLKRAILKNYWYIANFSKGGTATAKWEFANASDSNVKRVGEVYLSTNQELYTDTALEKGHLYIPQILSDDKKNFYPHSGLDDVTLLIDYDITFDGITTHKTDVEIAIPTRLKSNLWEAGKIYNYTIKIGGKQVPIEFDTDVTPWGIGDGHTGELVL